MISYNDIQTLIAEIDGVLPRNSQRVETAAGSLAEEEGKGIEESKQQAVLEKIRWYLLDLRNQIEITPSDSSQLATEQQETASAIANAVMAQLNSQRQDWLQPLQMEVEGLRQQRESLLQEIRTLEGKHLQLMSDFLQILLGRCSKALQQEFALSLEKFEAQLWQLQGTGDEKVNALTPLKHLDRLQQLRSLQQQADFLVLNLDSTFHKVFESLERDMQSYQKSLSQGIEQMHRLGQEGETVLAAYLHRLNAEALGQTPVDPSKEPNLSSPQIEAEEDAPTPEMSMFPFAGMEIPATLTASEESPRGWDVVEEKEESLESVDALFRVDIEGEEESSLLADDGIQGEAWEAWDEHLFHSDELMSEWEEDEAFTPIVLTLKEAELEALSAEESPIQELFAGLTDPAIAVEEKTESLAESPQNLSPSTVEAALFGEPIQETIAIAPKEKKGEKGEKDNIPRVEESSVSETDSQTLDEIVGETIASLTELLEEKSEQLAQEEEIIEEETISVTQGETLLATDEVRPQPQEDLQHLLDSRQLKTLTEDLANFEGNQGTSEIEFRPTELDIEEENGDEGVILSNVEGEREIHLNSPEIEAAMEVDEAFEEAFEEEILSEEDEDWIISETEAQEIEAQEIEAQEIEATETASSTLPPEAILTSLADLSWNVEEGMGNREEATEDKEEPSFELPASSLEIVVDDDFPSSPPQQVVKGARMGQDSPPVMRSPTTESKFVANNDDDLWDSPEAPRKASAYSQNSQDLRNKSQAIENSHSSVTEIATDPWSETPNGSERTQNKVKGEKN